MVGANFPTSNEVQLSRPVKMGLMELEDKETAQVLNGLDNQGLIDLLLTIDGERDRNVVLCLIRVRLAALAIELDQLKNQS